MCEVTMVQTIHYSLLAKQVEGLAGNVVKDEEAFCAAATWTGKGLQLAWIESNDDGEPQVEVRLVGEAEGLEPLYVKANPNLHELMDTIYGFALLET